MTSTVVPTARFARRRAPSARILLMPLMTCAIAAQYETSANAASFAATRTVTLITGDRVVISDGDKQSVTVQPRRGRERIVFSTTYQRVTAGQREHLFVIPADAQPLIGAGRLDRQFFDVTALLEASCDDAGRGKLSMLMTYSSQVSAASMPSAALPGATITSRFKSVNGVAASIDKQQLSRFWDTLTGSAANSPIKKVWLDRVYKVLPDQNTPPLGASLAVRSSSAGARVRVGIIGTGAAAAGQHRPLAPGADLITFKACAPTISGEANCTLNSVLEGMHWTVEQGARIVSMSFGQPDNPDEIDPLEEAVEQLTTQYGVLFVIAAGNAGDGKTESEPEAVQTPGSSPSALTVGAVDKAVQIAAGSSGGPGSKTYAIKPEITLPSTGAVADCAENAARASATSMAAPHVACAAAILLQHHPDWSPAQLKSALMSTGAGRVDLHAAIATSILSDTPSLNLGVAEFPHEDNPKITRTITYRNVGDISIWLKFNIEVRGPDGTLAPAGMFSLDRPTLIVPAGSTAQVTVTADTRMQAAFGRFSGRLLATGGGMSLSTPLAVFREKPAYNLTLKHIDRNGAQASDYVTTFVRLDEHMDPFPSSDGRYDGARDIKLRLPAGRYTVQTHFYRDPVALLVYPEFVLNAHTTLTLDARNATPLSVTPPAPTAKSFFLRTEYQASARWGNHVFGLQSYSTEDSAGCLPNCRSSFYTGIVGQPATHIRSYVNEHWKDSAHETVAENAPLYTAVFAEQGTLITGIKTVPVAEMSVVHARYAMSFPDPMGKGGLGIGVDVPGANQIHAAFAADVKFSHQRTEYYYSTDEDVRWYSAMVPDAYLRLDAPSNQYRPRHSYVTRWNEPPFAPVLPNSNPEVAWAYRTGDTMTVAIPILGDSQGHVISLPLDDDMGGKLALYRNGEKIAQVVRESSGEFQLQAVVSPEPATYRIEADATQQLLPLSPRVRGVWTFRSAHVHAGKPTRLPLLSVLFNPKLNEGGEAVRGTEFRVPLSIYQLDQQEPVQVNDVSIEASFDDGMSWRSVPVSHDTGEWIAVLHHPNHGRHVSLRASITGLSANTAEITLIRAYALTDGRAAD